MLTKLTKNITKSLNKQLQRSIVLGMKKRRGKFDKTNYIDDWVPKQRKYHKNRKPRQQGWDDKNVIWPPVHPRSYTGTETHLLKQLKQEEHQYLKNLKPFEYPDFRSGDVIKFHYIHSMSEGNGNTVVGVCLGVNKRGQSDANFLVTFNMAGVPVEMNVKMYSPMITEFELLEKGTGNIRNNIHGYFLKHPVKVPIGPMRRGKKMIKRRDQARHTGVTKEPEVTFDTIEDPLFN